MCTSRYAYQAPSAMLRARRRDANVRPNRWLDKKSSRGMLFENEELRLRTIEINAEVERGQGDIKKLKRQNEQLRREIWCLRDEYDKLEEQMRRMQDGEDIEYCDDGQEEDGEGYDDQPQIEEVKEKINTGEEECGPEDADNMQNLIASAKLLGLREQGAGCEAEDASSLAQPPSHELQHEPRDRPDLLVLPVTPLANAPYLHETHNTEALRRRTFAGEPAVTLHSSNDARFSLPPTASDLGATTTVVTSTSDDPRRDSECVSTMPGHEQQSLLPWPQHAPAWAISPFHEPPPTNLGRRPPPPPPPKRSSCEQVTTVRRASSVLPDGTTRRSVTFQADSVIYTPPTATSLQVQIPGASSPSGSDEEDDEETTLVVKGLERVPGLGARELIDALEQRLGSNELSRSVRAVCLHHQTVSATVSVGPRAAAMQLLSSGLEARGEPLILEEEVQNVSAHLGTDPSHIFLVSGVAHQVSDAAVRAAVARACGLRVSQVRRHVYKGVDTGERLVRVCPGSPPPMLQVTQAASIDGESKFRTHLSVQLRKPGENNVPAIQEQPRNAQIAPQNAIPAQPSPQCNGPVSPPPYTPPPPAVRRSSSSGTQRESRDTTTENSIENKPLNNVNRKKPSQNGGILRQEAVRRAAKSRSVSVESSARVQNSGSSAQRRRHGVFERPNSEELQQLQQQDEPIPSGPALPWCACWGNGCI